MESIGKKLQEARTAKGLDLDQISRETNIARRYLEGLENEQFGDFPGESYVIGFLRNYCEYLDLNGDEFVTLYKNQKIQETDVPVEQLLPKRPLSERLFGQNARKVGIAFIVILILAVLGFAGYMLIPNLISSAVSGSETQAPPPREAAVHELTGSEFRGRVFAGDSITVPIEGTIFSIAVQAVSPALRIESGGAVRTVELGQEIAFDISGDGASDARIFVSDLDADNPDAGAEITLVIGSPAQQTAEASSEDAIVALDGGTADSSGQTVLFESPSAYPITLSATFRGNCLFRYEIDRREREERLYQRSEVLNVQARDGFRIWASNGNAVRLQIIAGGRTVDLELSRPGEVIVKDLRWFRDDASGRYRFVAMDVD